MRNKLLVIGFFLTILIANRVYADGKIFQERAFKKAPAMPTQRAILRYKDGVETLIIEAAFDAEGKNFGWVIPVPAKPTNLEKASPGFLKTLSLNIQPKITHILSRKYIPVYGVVLLVFLWSIVVLIYKKGLLVELLVILLAILILFSIVSPAFQIGGMSLQRGVRKKESNQIKGITVHDMAEIGDYIVSVLEAEQSEALDTWLDKNGFVKLGEKGRSIVNDYIAHKWFFVTAKLHRNNSGMSHPYPIAIKFPTKNAVYPMRLTSLVENPLYLELFVISEEKANNPKLICEFCDVYSMKSRSWKNPNYTYMQGKRFGSVFHPDAHKKMWDGCVLTKLCGIVRPEQMKEDFILDWKGKAPYQKHYYSNRGAFHTAFLICLSIGSILILILIVALQSRIHKSDGRRFIVFRIYIPSIIFAFTLFALVYFLLPKTNVVIVGIEEQGDNYLYSYQFTDENYAMAWAAQNLPNPTKDAMTEFIQNYYRFQATRNAYTKERVRLEDSPGNLIIGENERGIYIRRINRYGKPEDFVLMDLQDDMKKHDYGKYGTTFRDETYLKNYLTQLENFDRHEKHRSRRILLALYMERPINYIPVILDHLDEQSRWKSMSRYGLEFELSMLGLIARIQPPLDVNDVTKVEEFLKNVKAWYVDQSKE